MARKPTDWGAVLKQKKPTFNAEIWAWQQCGLKRTTTKGEYVFHNYIDYKH